MLGGEDPAVGGPVRAIDVALHAGGVRGKTGWVGEAEADPDASGPPFIYRQSSPGLEPRSKWLPLRAHSTRCGLSQSLGEP